MEIKKVNSVKSFLEAIDSNAHIILEEGEYNLTDAYQDFAQTRQKYFDLVYDGYELIINNLTNLTIEGEGKVDIIANDWIGYTK